MAVWLFYLLVALLVLALLFLGLLAHAGYFSDLRIRTTSSPAAWPRRVAYTSHTGPYSNAGAAFQSINSLASKETHFGAYYDDPREVPAANLRYIVGCVLPETEESPLEISLCEKGYSVWTFPACSTAITAEYPKRGFLSCMLAPMVVYPALQKYSKKNVLECNGPIVEVYGEDKIRYMAPLESAPGFFVPEVDSNTKEK